MLNQQFLEWKLCFEFSNCWRELAIVLELLSKTIMGNKEIFGEISNLLQ